MASEPQFVPIDQWRRARAETRFWREACERMAAIAVEAASSDRPSAMAFALGKIAEGPQRPHAGIRALEYVGDEAAK